MSELLAEVDEMMRQERMAKLWKDHGYTIIGVVASIIIGTGVASAYKAWDQAERMESTNQLLDVVGDDAFPQNIEATQLEIRPGLKGIAIMTAASEFMINGESEKALALYAEAFKDDGIPDDLKDLASLNIAKLGNESTDEKLARLSVITANQKSPWRHQALLQSAVILANEKQNFQAAVSALENILKTPNLPNTLYAKAQSLTQVYVLKMSSDTNSGEQQP